MKFKFANSNRNDLWDAFTNIANEFEPDFVARHNFSVGDIAESWINQTGYPLITVFRNDNTKEISISQVRSFIQIIPMHLFYLDAVSKV